MLDEDRLERWLGDLEVVDERATCERGSQHVAWLDARPQLELREAGTRTYGSDAVELREPRRQDLALDAETDRACPAGPLQLPERATCHEPAVIDDRQRLAERLGRLHLVRREHDRPA